MKKKLSIVIPVYNVEKYLRRCLDSIVCQDLSEIDIILIDDGSTDESGKICDDYSKEYKNIKTFHKKNGGASDARNYGIKKVNSDYIWFVDSDDYIEKGCIKDFLSIMKNYKSDVIICQSKVVEEGKKLRDECIYSINSGEYSSASFMKVLKKNPKSVIFCPQCYIVSREFIVSNNLYFYKGIIHEDELWIPQLLIYAKKIYYSGLNIYYHYMWSESVMHSTKREKSGRSAYIVATEMLAVFEECKRNDLGFLRDHNTNIFLQAVWKIPGFLNDKEKIMRSMPLKNSIYLKTKIKSLLYYISPKFYLLIHSLRDNIKK